MMVTPSHTHSRSGSGSQINKVVRMPAKASITDQPGGVNSAPGVAAFSDHAEARLP